MSAQFILPVKIISGHDCVKDSETEICTFGKKFLIVTGRSSAKKCGALDDVIHALESGKCEYEVFDKIPSNPDIDIVYEGAKAARQAGAEAVIAIGGGSPMDAAKAIALLATQDIARDELFSGCYEEKNLPVICVPTTAGTGSEVTQYSILTNHKAKTKTTLSAPFMFPKLALLDGKYMAGLPERTTVNTAMDAMTHLMESYLSVKAGDITRSLSTVGLEIIGRKLEKLSRFDLSDEDRAELLTASNLGGIVIAQTGTTAVHAMGYSLTYFKEIDHGRANGLLMAEYLRFAEKTAPGPVEKVLKATGFKDVSSFGKFISELLGEREKITSEELKMYSEAAIKAKNIPNSIAVPSEEDLYGIYSAVFSDSSPEG